MNIFVLSECPVAGLHRGILMRPQGMDFEQPAPIAGLQQGILPQTMRI